MDEAEIMRFFGPPGAPVPKVDAEDVKAVWLLGRDIQARHPAKAGELRAHAVGIEIFKAACKPGANIPAVSYRGMMLGMLIRHAPEQLAPWLKEGNPDDAVFRAIAQVPMEWMGVGIVRNGLPFDTEDFMRRVNEAA
jgi:hypothetical protein